MCCMRVGGVHCFLKCCRCHFTLHEGKFNIPDTINNVKVMIGIRENYYSQNEIKEWIKNGKIKKFKR